MDKLQLTKAKVEGETKRCSEREGWLMEGIGVIETIETIETIKTIDAIDIIDLTISERLNIK